MGLGTDVSPADSDVTRIGLEQELGGGAGQPELEEENVEEDDEYTTGEMRGRFLPSLTPPDGGRQRNVSIMEDHDTSGSSQQPRGTWSQAPPNTPASRRWSTSESRQQSQVKAQGSQQHVQQASPTLQRFTHGGSVHLGALQESQELDHDWQQSPQRANPYGVGDPVSPPFPQGRGRSASTLVSSSYGQSEQY